MTSRAAVVLGGSRGIGLACAAGLLAEGHEVTITGRNRESLDKARSSLDTARVRTLVLDSTHADRVANELADRPVEILVVNSGIGFSATLADTSLEDWNRVLQANVTAAFVALRTVVPTMVRSRWGRVITIGSLASHQGLRFASAYVSSKHALHGLTRAIAEEVAGTGVTVNMVSPAFVRTEMTTKNAQRIADASGRTLEEAELALAGLTPLGRLLEPDEVAEEVLRFTRPEAADINGTAVILDGRGA